MVSAFEAGFKQSTSITVQNNIYWADYRVHGISEGTACLSIAPAGERETAHKQVTVFTTAQ